MNGILTQMNGSLLKQNLGFCLKREREEREERERREERTALNSIHQHAHRVGEHG